MADDADFANAVESNPTDALRGLNLTAHDIVRIEEAVQQVHGPTPRSRSKRRGASLAAVITAPIVFGLGAFALTSSGAVLDQSRSETLRREEVAIYACPETNRSSTRAYEWIGRVHRGDRVRVVGRTGSQWLVIRHPDDLRLPAWVPVDAMDPDETLAGIQEMSCSAAVRVAAGPVVDEPAVRQIAEVGGTGAATTSTSTTSTSSPPVVAASVVAVPSPTTPAPATSTTLSASTTTRAAVLRSSTTTGLSATHAPAPTTTAAPTTTVASTAPVASTTTMAPTTPVASTTTLAPTTTTSTTTTVVPTTVPVVVTPSPSTTSTTAVPLPSDKTGPTVALTLSRDYLYTGSNLLPCRDEGTVDLAVTLDDPTQPPSVTEATWSFVGSNGAARTGALAPLSTGRYRFGPVDVGGPNGGAVPVTFKVTASDGASNSTVKTITVSLRAAGAVCIG